MLKAKNDVLEKTYKDSVKEMNIRIQEEQVLKAEIEELKNTEKAEKSEKEDEGKRLRGFDIKNLVKPDPYDGKIEKYKIWNELFSAQLTSIDDRWEEMLQQMSNTEKEIEEIVEHLEMNIEEIPKVKRMMYLSLLQHTAGDAQTMVISKGVDLSIDAYRIICRKGKNETTMNRLRMLNKAMHPDPATKLDEIEMKIDKWKEDLRYLTKPGEGDGLSMDQKMSIFVSMMPEEVASHLIKTWKTYSTDQDLENEVMDILKNEEMKPKPKGKALGAVTDDSKIDEGKDAKVPMYYWDEHQQGFIGMTIPAGKRRRENDDDEEEKDDGMDGQKGGSKGKGKGPKDGCFNCGGAHYASACPKGKGKGKDSGKGGKGKGKDKGGGKSNNWFTPRQWTGTLVHRTNNATCRKRQGKRQNEQRK